MPSAAADTSTGGSPQRAARLCTAALAHDEATKDEATLAAEVRAERHAHRAQLTADRDRYARAAKSS
jgi:hypothetical protein